MKSGLFYWSLLVTGGIILLMFTAVIVSCEHGNRRMDYAREQDTESAKALERTEMIAAGYEWKMVPTNQTLTPQWVKKEEQ